MPAKENPKQVPTVGLSDLFHAHRPGKTVTYDERSSSSDDPSFLVSIPPPIEERALIRSPRVLSRTLPAQVRAHGPSMVAQILVLLQG